MTSFGAENQTHSVTFPTTFSIQGQVYHRIGSLMPSENQPSRFLQIYFVGNDDDDIQTDRRYQKIQGVRRNIVQGLQRMLHQHNLLVQQFKTALENLPSDAYRVVVNADRTPPGQHPRRYNAPTANEVAVVLAGNQFGSRDIVLHQRDNLLKYVSDTHRFYDALQYPLIFWKGQEGYSFHIPQIDPNTRQPLSSKVSSMDFYGYFIMVRRNSPNVIVQFGQLFHQFLVDMYAKVESERLRYITLHQRNLRAESYIYLRDALSTDANINPNSLGQRIILPSSFVNSPRYLAEYTQDAFCYVRKFGRPDLFITFTSNPSWEELSAALLPGQKQLDRHDITARVFRQKLVKFIGALTKGQLYGATVAWMYCVEWQKRGLPHAHILVWLANKLRPTQIDSVICAEFPDPIQDPLLYNIVVKNMIHGPCVCFVTHYDANKELVLACDSSSYGLGVILSHRNDREEECPIAFASRTLTEAEKRQYLLGRKFVLVTDNRPLIHILLPQKPIPICAASRIKIWSLKLAAFNYTVGFRKSSDNSYVDALLRLPLESSVRESLDEDQVLLLRKLNEVPFSFREVAYETSRDKILSIVLRNVRKGNWKFTRVLRENPLAPYYKINEGLSLEFGCLQWRERVSGIDSDIEELTRECRVCQESACHRLPSRNGLGPKNSGIDFILI
ncbi:hypothetical protein LAZ67_6003616 [Cordylochernes scorpioides]|uniref:Helitron helicase-like domain-containing protein n=1 Tax=Cordylochernes scorpioides TaxID=51811 RepID=A0ABY6KL48_9ARAC|nr:hypothetical protein LAZ67_6003616 [Cordylochernes scorpioides]